MPGQKITIEIPAGLSKGLQKRGLSKQQIQAMVVDYLQNYLQHPPTIKPQQPAGEEKFGSKNLEQLDTPTLWRVVRTTTEQLTTLRKQAELSPLSQEELHETLQQYDQAMVRRAKAITILKKRGHDISSLQPPAYNP